MRSQLLVILSTTVKNLSEILHLIQVIQGDRILINRIHFSNTKKEA